MQSNQEPKDIIAFLEKYWSTYRNQKYCDEFPRKAVIEDALYGIGVAINPDRYRTEDGYTRFKQELSGWLAEPERFEQI